MSYDVCNFRILTGLIQVENDTNLHGYLDVGFRVDYLDTAGYNTTKQWIDILNSRRCTESQHMQKSQGIRHNLVQKTKKRLHQRIPSKDPRTQPIGIPRHHH